MRDSWPFVAALVAIVAIMGGVGWMAGAPEREGWRLCEDAIMATLKAPATYKRVEGSGTYAVSNDMFRITYDAANGFGVPIRSTGSCIIDATGKAAWVEYPDSMRR